MGWAFYALEEARRAMWRAVERDPVGVIVLGLIVALAAIGLAGIVL